MFQKRNQLAKGNPPNKTSFKKGHNPWNKGKKELQTKCNWKGGKMKSRNRWLIWKPKHPFAPKNGYIRQSHLVAEKILGRYLTELEVIHHINGNSSDDKPKNLYLFATTGKHTQYHFLKIKPILKSNLTL